MTAIAPPSSDPGHQRGQPRYRFDIPLTEVTSLVIRRFDDYWRRKSSHGRLPGRPDLDPAEITPLLPDLVLLNVEWKPFRCSMRLRGTRVERFRPKDPTTRYVDEATVFEPGRREDYLAELEFVATNRRPAFARDWVTTKFGTVRDILAGIWPLAADGEHVDMLVVIEDFAGLDVTEFDWK